MKKFTLIAILFLAATFTFSQTTQDTAINFTATDTHGIERNLFDILDGGQYVVIDFFFANCGACIETAPYISEAYELFGCNTADVFIMSVSVEDDSATCIAFNEQYGIEFPCISGVEGRGDTICNAYGIDAFSTYILIDTNHLIVEQDMWPIPNTQQFVTYFENNGLVQAECAPASVTTTINNHLLRLFPNPTTGVFEIELNYNGNLSIDVFNVIGENVFQKETTSYGYYRNSIDLTGLESGFYFITLRFKDETIVKKLQIINK